jgi:DNA-binding MarR family transcriptional regulator
MRRVDPDVKPSELALRLREVQLAEHALQAAIARDVGLGETDWQALGALFEGEPLGPTELGRRVGLGSAAATALVDRLERAGHVERRPHPHDRRRQVLAPTTHAEQELWRVLTPLVRGVDELAEGLDEGERAAVARFLAGVAELYRRRAAEH